MHILITGSNGLLGQKLVKQCLKRGLSFTATSAGSNRNPQCPEDCFVSLDITTELDVNHVLEVSRPTHVIHTAAMTNVDECELNPENCQRVNVEGTKYLFYACASRNIHFNLLSTDFVFDGENGPYRESDSVNPLSVYAQSKVDAERLLLDANYSNWCITRTIIVYGVGNNLSRSNLIVWARKSLLDNQSMNIIDDQFRAPTWADDLAWACLELAIKNKTGVFHICGPKTESVYEIVVRIANYLRADVKLINKISSKTLNQPAKRPPKTGFILDKAMAEIGYQPTSLEDALQILESEIQS